MYPLFLAHHCLCYQAMRAIKPSNSNIAPSSMLVTVLLEHPLLALLPLSLLQEFVQTGCVQHKEADRLVLRIGKPVHAIFFLLHGALKLYHRHLDEREILVKLLQGPAMFAESEALHHLPAMTSAVTLTPCLLLAMPIPLFEQALAQHKDFAKYVLQDVTLRFCRALSNEKDLAFHQVIPRLARLLLAYNRIFSTDEQNKWIAISRTTLAKDLGISRKAVLQAFAQLAQQGMLAKSNKGWLITNESAMESLTGNLLPLLHETSI